MAEMKVSVDMSELDAATEKAAHLMKMLDEIEARFDKIDARAAASNGKTYPYPPRLSPEANAWICDQCGRRWGMGQDPQCAPCAQAFGKS